MESRLDLLSGTVTSKFIRYLQSASKVVAASALPAATQELVRLRASQINGSSKARNRSRSAPGRPQPPPSRAPIAGGS
jgi:hypothetical protein